MRAETHQLETHQLGTQQLGTHQLGRAIRVADVLELLDSLLGAGAPGDAARVTLDDLSVGAEGLGDLWDAACEEFVDRTLGPELDPDAFDPSMSRRIPKTTMAALLRAGAGDAS